MALLTEPCCVRVCLLAVDLRFGLFAEFEDGGLQIQICLEHQQPSESISVFTSTLQIPPDAGNIEESTFCEFDETFSFWLHQNALCPTQSAAPFQLAFTRLRCYVLLQGESRGEVSIPLTNLVPNRENEFWVEFHLLHTQLNVGSCHLRLLKRSLYGDNPLNRDIYGFGFRHWNADAERIESVQIEHYNGLCPLDAIRAGSPKRRATADGRLRRDWTPSLDSLEMASAGFPRAYRGEIWYRLSGADLKRRIESAAYEKYCLAGSYALPAQVQDDIEKDISRTYPSHPWISGPHGARSLRRILYAYAQRNPSVGYCQGLNYIGATLLLFLEEIKAFWVLCCLIEHICPNYHSPSMLGVKVDVQVVPP